jgi:hypothetical protein
VGRGWRSRPLLQWVCRGAKLVENRYSLDDDGRATAVQDVPSRDPSVATSRDAQRETVFHSETGDELLFNLSSRRLSTTTQPHAADTPVSYRPMTASASMQTRADTTYLSYASQCGRAVLTVSYGPGREAEAASTWRQWCILHRPPAGADSLGRRAPLVAVLLSYCKIHYGCTGVLVSLCAWARFAPLHTCGLRGLGARPPVTHCTNHDPHLHQSSPRCRSPRCIPVVAESYHQRRAAAPGRSNKSWG